MLKQSKFAKMLNWITIIKTKMKEAVTGVTGKRIFTDHFA
jgi:hypothetical protein